MFDRCNKIYTGKISAPIASESVKVERFTLNCDYCKREFLATANKIKRGRKYCSNDCLRLYWKSLWIERQCKWCDKKFTRVISQFVDGNECNFCSTGCGSAWRIRQEESKISKISVRFFDLLEKNGFPVDREQPVGRKIIDGIAKNINVAIEFHGDFWHNLPGAKERDDNKAQQIAWAGYKLIVVWEHEFKADPHAAVKRVIAEANTL